LKLFKIKFNQNMTEKTGKHQINYMLPFLISQLTKHKATSIIIYNKTFFINLTRNLTLRSIK
jgi:hypothetical protein